MSQAQPAPALDALPNPIVELCAHLESHHLPSYRHGEGLLDDMHTRVESNAEILPTRSLLVAGEAVAILRALPHAVVTAEAGSRLTQATEAGPVDLIPTEGRPIEDTLLEFGLGPLAVAVRPSDETWVDPANQLRALAEGRLELAAAGREPFRGAPRRYWISARLLAERGLQPDAELVTQARTRFPEIAARLPHGAPARREITRILACPDPRIALAFLREVGVSASIAPGIQETSEARIARLPALPALRWAAWLRGSATTSAMVRLRVPHRLARRVERIQGAHPIERTVAAGRDVGLRKLSARLSPEEIDALFTWRRVELEDAVDREKAREVEARLVDLEDRLSALREGEARAGFVRKLALDGRAVMALLGGGPGRHVGQALSHLARHVAERPEDNDPATLEGILRDWALAHTNLLD